MLKMIKIIKDVFPHLTETSQNHVFKSKMDANFRYLQNCQHEHEINILFKIK